MKKFLALLIAMCCLFSFCMVSVAAEDVYDPGTDDDFSDDILGDLFGDMDVKEILFSTSATLYYSLAELMDGYFAEGGSPSAEVIVLQIEGYIYSEEFDQYIVGMDDMGWFVTYHIPSEVYEELVFFDFTKSDAIIETLRNSDYYNADGDYYIIETGGGFGDLIPEFSYYGYAQRNDGSYVVYGQLVEMQYDDNFEIMPYEPQEGDVEGIDYMYVADTWINPEDIPDDAMEFENIKQYSGYRAYKLAGFVEAVFEYDEDMMSATISSFEKITGQAVPEDDSIKLPGVSDILADSVEGMMALLYGAYVDFESTGFEKNVILSTEKITTGESYDAALVAMEGVSENIAVFEFIATKDQQTVQPANPVRVTLAVPEDFSAQFGVFSVSPDGTLTKLDMNVDVDMGVVTTYLSQLGTVVIADAPVVATPETEPETELETEPEGNPETEPETEAETKAPEAETTVPELEKAPVKSPQTGDNMMIVAIIALAALSACAAVVIRRKAVK